MSTKVEHTTAIEDVTETVGEVRLTLDPDDPDNEGTPLPNPADWLVRIDAGYEGEDPEAAPIVRLGDLEDALYALKRSVREWSPS